MAARSEAPAAGAKKSALPVLLVIGALAAVVGGGFVALKMGVLHLPGAHGDDSLLAKSGETPSSSTLPTPVTPKTHKSALAASTDGVNLDEPAAEPADVLPDGGAHGTHNAAMRL